MNTHSGHREHSDRSTSRSVDHAAESEAELRTQVQTAVAAADTREERVRLLAAGVAELSSEEAVEELLWAALIAGGPSALPIIRHWLTGLPFEADLMRW